MTKLILPIRQATPLTDEYCYSVPDDDDFVPHAQSFTEDISEITGVTLAVFNEDKSCIEIEINHSNIDEIFNNIRKIIKASFLDKIVTKHPILKK